MPSPGPSSVYLPLPVPAGCNCEGQDEFLTGREPVVTDAVYGDQLGRRGTADVSSFPADKLPLLAHTGCARTRTRTRHRSRRTGMPLRRLQRRVGGAGAGLRMRGRGRRTCPSRGAAAVLPEPEDGLLEWPALRSAGWGAPFCSHGPRLRAASPRRPWAPLTTAPGAVSAPHTRRAVGGRPGLRPLRARVASALAASHPPQLCRFPGPRSSGPSPGGTHGCPTLLPLPLCVPPLSKESHKANGF